MNISSFIAAIGTQTATTVDAISHAAPSVLSVVGFVTLIGIVVSFAIALLIKGLHLGIERFDPPSAPQ
jgi:sensor histidine kinase regulating citrate/malate metabolism